MFQLGNSRYEGLLGFETLEFSREADYKEHALLGIKPRTQRVGDKLETLSLSLKLHGSFCVPEDVIDELEKSRAIGEILGLYTASGRYYGDYLIKTLKVRVEKLAPGASGILAASVDIELMEYFYADRAAAARRASRQVAFALDSVATPFPDVTPPPVANTPPTTTSEPPTTTSEPSTLATYTPTPPNVGAKPTPLAATLSRLQQVAGTVVRLASTLRQAQANPSRRAYLLADAAKQAGDLHGQAGGLVAFLTNTPSPSGATSALLYALSGSGLTGGVLALSGTLQTQAGAGDLAGAITTAGNLQTEQARIRAASQDIATSAAVGRNPF